MDLLDNLNALSCSLVEVVVLWRTRTDSSAQHRVPLLPRDSSIGQGINAITRTDSSSLLTSSLAVKLHLCRVCPPTPDPPPRNSPEYKNSSGNRPVFQYRTKREKYRRAEEGRHLVKVETFAR